MNVKNKKGPKKSKNNKMTNNVTLYPKRLLEPVGTFLHNKLKMLEKRRKGISEEDPFKDEGRVDDNASPDTDAAEQYGHARTSAIKEQIDKKIIQTRKALSRVYIGKYGICADCGNFIDTDRLMVYPEAIFCAKCMKKRE